MPNYLGNLFFAAGTPEQMVGDCLGDCFAFLLGTVDVSGIIRLVHPFPRFDVADAPDRADARQIGPEHQMNMIANCKFGFESLSVFRQCDAYRLSWNLLYIRSIHYSKCFYFDPEECDANT